MRAAEIEAGLAQRSGAAPRSRPHAGLGRAGRRAATSLGALVVLTLCVELVVRAGHVATFIFPPPSAVLAELGAEPALFVRNALVTLAEAGAGLLLGATVALAFAAAATHSRRLDAALTPLVVASQTVPVIALAPLLVLWMGYGAPPKIVICALISFFPMAVTAREGLRATDPQLLLLMRSVGARATDVFWRVRVPAAAPYLAAGLRTGITLSLVGAVVAEWTGADSRARLPRALGERPAGDRPGVRCSARDHPSRPDRLRRRRVRRTPRVLVVLLCGIVSDAAQRPSSIQ